MFEPDLEEDRKLLEFVLKLPTDMLAVFEHRYYGKVLGLVTQLILLQGSAKFAMANSFEKNQYKNMASGQVIQVFALMYSQDCKYGHNPNSEI